MTAINSNRAIRGPVTAVPVVAGKGVKITADTVNNRYVAEVDETVLWEDANGATSATLSEASTNFESLVVVAASSEMTNKVEFRVNPDAATLELSHWFMEPNGTYVICAFGTYSVSNNGITLTGTQVKHTWFTFSNFGFSGTGTNGLKLFKVVGINRIASN